MAKDKCKTHGCSLFPYKDGYCIQCVLKGLNKPERKKKLVNKHNHLGFKSQIDLFKYCWNEHKRKCYVTNEDLNKYNGSVQFLSIFAHVLRKSAFQEFRYYINNIVLVKPEIHHLLDNGTLDQILKFEAQTGYSFRVIFELEQDVYNEYVSSFGKKTPPRKIVGRYLGLKN